MKKIYILYIFILFCAFSCLDGVNMSDERQNADLPQLITEEVPDKVTFYSATLSASIESANGYEITARGFIYGSDNTLKGNRDSISVPLETNGIGDFSLELEGLLPHTEYYYVAFATNGKGTQYSKILKFKTWSETPTLETEDPKNIQDGNALISGLIISIGAAPVEECGICFSTTSENPIYDTDSTIVSSNLNTEFSIPLDKLAGSQSYYIRAYAKNSYGIAYGTTKILQTPNIWEKMADFGGKGRMAYTTFVISDYFYVAAGEDENSYFLNDLWVYNPASNTWTSKSLIPPYSRKAPSSFVIGHKGYIGLGISGSNPNLSDFYFYQPNRNEWLNIEKSFPGQAREYSSSFSLNNCGYIIGGQFTDGLLEYKSLSDAWKYENTNDTWNWKSITPFPVPIHEALTFVYNNKAFVGLGSSSKPGSYTYYDKIWMYNPDADSWNVVATVPGEFNYKNGGITGATVVDDYAYIIDGNNRIWTLNLNNYEWSKKSEMTIPKAYSDNQCMFAYKNESKNEHEIFVGLNHLSTYFYKYRPYWDNPVK